MHSNTFLAAVLASTAAALPVIPPPAVDAIPFLPHHVIMPPMLPPNITGKPIAHGPKVHDHRLPALNVTAEDNHEVEGILEHFTNHRRPVRNITAEDIHVVEATLPHVVHDYLHPGHYFNVTAKEMLEKIHEAKMHDHDHLPAGWNVTIMPHHGHHHRVSWGPSGIGKSPRADEMPRQHPDHVARQATPAPSVTVEYVDGHKIVWVEPAVPTQTSAVFPREEKVPVSLHTPPFVTEEAKVWSEVDIEQQRQGATQEVGHEETDICLSFCQENLDSEQCKACVRDLMGIKNGN